MSDKLSRLGVVTVTYNAEAHVARFLRCCLAQTHGNFELLVIDNASGDGTTALLLANRHPGLSLLRNEKNVGYAAACNQAIAYFRERNAAEILFINNDTEFGPDLFESLAITRAASAADAVVPRIVLGSDTRLNWYAGGRFVFWKAFQAEMMGEGQRNDPSDAAVRYTPVAPGCCILFTLPVIEAVGPFDETFFVYFEDTDYCLRMAYLARTILYTPMISLIHHVSTSTGGPVSPFSIRFYNRNQAYILRKHFALPVLALQLPLIFAKAFFRLVAGRDTSAGFLLRLQATCEGLRLPLPSRRWSRYRAPRVPPGPRGAAPLQ